MSAAYPRDASSRWAAADSDTELLAAEAVLSDPATPWKECGVWETDGPAVLMDSAEAGKDLGVPYPDGRGQPDEAPRPVPVGSCRGRRTMGTPCVPQDRSPPLGRQSPARPSRCSAEADRLTRTARTRAVGHCPDSPRPDPVAASILYRCEARGTSCPTFRRLSPGRTLRSFPEPTNKLLLTYAAKRDHDTGAARITGDRHSPTAPQR
ncbi:Imm21 family immunity protein [Streptomyces flaveolus]|uniref:Imm21 family immunity protein n=1 Tax=Streptomyces flaveolus TaxID=67297 RepID=UPI003412F0EF